jgi:alpha-tubulin suppressor-like RCC1 family protein
LATLSSTLSSLADGRYYACVTAADAAQNLRLAANNGHAFDVDTLPPTIDLGPRRVTGNSFTIRPSVTDAGPLTYAWSKVSGPGVVTFGAPTAKDTLIAATVEGDYVLRLTATDQVGLSSTATFTLTWDRSRLVSAGRHVTCAITPGGQLHCWGRNRQGEVGTGDTLQRTSPFAVSVGTGRSVLSVAVASFHTCAILDDGSVRCWGGNLTELGYGDTVDRITPTSEALNLGSGRSAVALAAGYSHTCAVLDDGSVKCWGANGSGQLGYGDTTDRSGVPATAIDLGPGRSAVELSLGSLHSCARLDDGSVKCWGANGNGQLGYGDTTGRLAPPATPVSMPGGLTAKQLDAGDRHLCAILSDDSIACWGVNNLGQLGDRTNTERSTPVLVTGFSGTPKRLALGYAHSCALRSDGTVSCWGNVPTAMGAGREAQPTDCSDGVSVSTTACTAAGGAFSAENRDCSTGSSTSPAACTASGGSWGSCSDFTKVSVGSCGGTWDPSKYAYCSKSDGTQKASQYCASAGGILLGWGYCGDPSYLNRIACLAAGKSWHLATVPGPDLAFGAGRSVIALESGLNAIWLCAVLDNLDLKCWGDNTNGQLGYGDSYLSAPFANVDLGTGETAQSVAVALTHTCALTGSGAVKCWGDNAFGKLGNGSYADSATPTTVGLAAAATDLATQRDHGCAVLSTGGVQCWGTHGSGRLGSGSSSGESASPVNVANLGGTAIQVVAGADFTCALLAGGAVKCWGSMAQGRLGSGSAAVTTSCSDGVQTTSTACTAVGGTFNGNLYADCSNGMSTSQAACEAVTNGKWAHCSNGISSTATLCTTAAKVWDPSLYAYCTSSAATVAAGTFCTSMGGGFTNYGYCADPSYKTRPTCLNAGKTWHVHTLPGPALDFGGVPATQLAAGAHGACALLQGGSVRCWGGNNYMQIGVNDTVTTNNYLVPAPAIDFGGHTVKRISASSTFFCAILDDDSLRCWGGSSSHYGQLGYPPTTGNIPMPSAAAVDFGAGRSVQAVATQSDGHGNCAILDDDSLRCFGNTQINWTSGILKDDNTSSRLSPIDLGSAAAPTSVSVGNFAYCLTFADGTLRCGGHHNHGQPGQGFSTFRWLPPAPKVLGL